MKKLTKMNEAAWLLGTVLCALGVALCTKAGFGLSMIAAPPYIIHLKLYRYCHFFTQGACNYLWQGFIMILLSIFMRRFKLNYLYCFFATVIFGVCVDLWLFVLGGGGVASLMAMRIVYFCIGELSVAVAIAFCFRTTLPVQVCDLAVTEIASRLGENKDKVKLVNDIVMLIVSVALAIALNRSLDGLGIGTLIITVINAPLIALIGRLLDKTMEFSPRFPKLSAIFSCRKG